MVLEREPWHDRDRFALESFGPARSSGLSPGPGASFRRIPIITERASRYKYNHRTGRGGTGPGAKRTRCQKDCERTTRTRNRSSAPSADRVSLSPNGTLSSGADGLFKHASPATSFNLCSARAFAGKQRSGQSGARLGLRFAADLATFGRERRSSPFTGRNCTPGAQRRRGFGDLRGADHTVRAGADIGRGGPFRRSEIQNRGSIRRDPLRKCGRFGERKPASRRRRACGDTLLIFQPDRRCGVFHIRPKRSRP